MRGSLRHAGVTLGLASLLALLGTACGPDKPSTVSPEGGGAAGGAGGPAGTQHGMLPNASVLEGAHGMGAPNTAGVLRTTQQSGETAFDASAPATVLVTTRWGHGSGVIVDPSGLVLTNYHVIESGQDENFQFKVQVTTVDIQKNGSVKPGTKYDAVALKVDPKRDLALLKLEGGPANLPTAPVAQGDPKPGRRVVAIGNAGVGFGWAVKHCSINAIGTLESRAAAIFALQADTWTEEERAKMEDAIAEAAKEAGLQIQTDCTILPGDSGGPLLDEETHELVGLNVAVAPAVKQQQSLGSVAYHVHVSELRDFMRVVPDKAATWVPDPWEVSGSQGTLADTDKDGDVDSLLVMGICNESLACHAIFADLDQDSFQHGKPTPTIGDVYAERAFDAEFVAFAHARLPRSKDSMGGHIVPITDTLIYLDRDNDGTLESLVVYDGETGETRGYKGLDGAAPARDKDLDGREQLGDDIFHDPQLGARAKQFAEAFERPSNDPHAPKSTKAIEVKFADHNKDGQADTLYAQTRLDTRMVIDADQDSIAKLSTNEQASQALADDSLDGEFLAVTGTPMKVWYDTDDDGTYDLVLIGPSLDRGVAMEATSFDGKMAKPAPEHVGRRMLRPGLMKDPEKAANLERMFSGAFPQAHAAVDDGLSSFPDVGVHVGAGITEIKDSKKSAVQVVEYDRIMVFADLDKNTFKGDAKGLSLDAAVRGGQFDAEFVFVFDGLMAWAYYDTDGDGAYDTVLVSRAGDPLHAEEVYRVEKGKLEWETPAEKTPMFDSSRLTSKKAKKAFTKFEKQVLDPQVMGEAR